MSNWQNDGWLAGRYAVAGILNTAVGLTVLFGLIYHSGGPIVSKFAGYARSFTMVLHLG
jgi:putative flippase GtrA